MRELRRHCEWQNGNLNGNNSAYAEGDVVPFRLAIEGLAAGLHTIHINYDFTAGGHEAYDFLATYNATESVDLCAAGGGGRIRRSVRRPSRAADRSPLNFPTDGSPCRMRTTRWCPAPTTRLSRDADFWGGDDHEHHLRTDLASDYGHEANSTAVDLTVTFT